MLRSGLPFGGGLELLVAGGAAYLAWEHEQGRHTQASLVCPICWLNKIAPASQPAAQPTPEHTPDAPE